MTEIPNDVRRAPARAVSLDAVDRKLLRHLAEDATRTYAELGKLVHLTAPAVHERVKRLKREGVILGTVARLDGDLIGCPLLAFIHVESEGRGLFGALEDFGRIADVEEIHTVAGDTSVILKVRTRDTGDLEALLVRLHAVDGVRGTRSYVALNSYLERGPKPEVEM